MTAHIMKAEEFGVSIVWYLALSSPFVPLPTHPKVPTPYVMIMLTMYAIKLRTFFLFTFEEDTESTFALEKKVIVLLARLI